MKSDSKTGTMSDMIAQQSPVAAQARAPIEELPSSAKAVFSLLVDGKARTLNEMTGNVSFSPRTIRNALNRLKDAGLIVAKFNFRDARKPLYQLKTA